MKDDDRSRDISRRNFLLTAAGAAGTAVTGLAFGAQPCPPPQLSVSGGTTSSTTCVPSTPGALPVLKLTSAAASGVQAWTAGHAFRQGDVPSGSYITSNGTATQADVRNRWPDGSVKFAVLSGTASFTQNTVKSLQLATTTTAPSGSVAEPTSLDVSVTFSGAVSGTYTLQSALGVDRSTWNKSAAGRVRQIPGPVMSEFHYYVPTSDAHVTVWFYVRRYSNGQTEIETVVENGWLKVASPGERDYTVTVSVGGATTYSGTLNHYNHTRWARVDWLGTDPKITPQHDAVYLRATKMVPNYGYGPPASGAFTGLATAVNPAPFALGNWSAQMGDTGDAQPIGVLPHWEALYCLSGDARAYAATISNNRGSGRWPIHYRDETTGRIPLYSSYPSMSLNSGWGSQPPTPSGGSNGGWDVPHHPSNGYLAYLIEGRWTQLESLQCSAYYTIQDSNPQTRQGGGAIPCLNAPLTTRGAAWSWRTVGQAAAISPTKLNNSTVPAADLALGDSFRKSVDDTMLFTKGRYIDGGVFKNTIGYVGQYDGGDDGPAGEWWGRAFMVQFQIAALAHISDLGIEGINQSNLVAVRNHAYDGAVGLMGTDVNWNYRRGARYNAPFFKNSTNPGSATPAFMTWGEMTQTYLSFYKLSALSSNIGDTLKDHSSDSDMNPTGSSNDADGYWAPVIANLATAVEHGKLGALAAYTKVTSASNYNPVGHDVNLKPKWAIRPRS